MRGPGNLAAVSVCLSNPLDRLPNRDYLAAKSKYIGGGSGNGSAVFLYPDLPRLS